MIVIKGENQSSDKVPDTVLFYSGEFGYCFSNFSSFAVKWQDRVWPTSEHAYQAAAFADQELVEAIAKTPSAHEAFKFARAHNSKKRSDWQEIKYQTMKDICRAKLQQHPYIEKTLRQTGTSKLVEDSPKDGCWGRGENWQGDNWLGQVWMELRAELDQ